MNLWDALSWPQSVNVPLLLLPFRAPEAAKSATNTPEEQKRCLKHPVLQKWLQFVALDVRQPNSQSVSKSSTEKASGCQMIFYLGQFFSLGKICTLILSFIAIGYSEIKILFTLSLSIWKIKHRGAILRSYRFDLRLFIDFTRQKETRNKDSAVVWFF